MRIALLLTSTLGLCTLGFAACGGGGGGGGGGGAPAPFTTEFGSVPGEDGYMAITYDLGGAIVPPIAGSPAGFRLGDTDGNDPAHHVLRRLLFSIPTYALPAGASIVSAELRLHVNAYAGLPGQTWQLDHVVVPNLDGTSATAAQAFLEAPTGGASGTTYANGVPRAVGWVAIDVTSIVQSSVNMALGRTQIRVRLADENPVGGNGQNDYYDLGMGEDLAGFAPVCVVTWRQP